jgi:hypothetical protein
MKKINEIFIHHSASEFGDAELIDRWHKERGFKGIGYHFVVLNSFLTYREWHNDKINADLLGKIEKGRPLDADPWLEAEEIGAHVYGFNSDSIGICLIHNSGQLYNIKQLDVYRRFCAGLMVHFDIPVANVQGHYEVEPKKPLCPSLDMNNERVILADMIKTNQEILRQFALKYLY